MPGGATEGTAGA